MTPRLKHSIRVLMPVLGLSLAVSAQSQDNASNRPAGAEQSPQSGVTQEVAPQGTAAQGASRGSGAAATGTSQGSAAQTAPPQTAPAQTGAAGAGASQPAGSTSQPTGSTAQPTAAPAAQPGGERMAQRRMTGELRASDLIGKSVDAARQEDIGEVADLIVDANSGRIGYAVLSIGGFLGIGERLVVYPADRLQVAEDGESVRVSATRDELRRARSFERDQWPDWNLSTMQERRRGAWRGESQGMDQARWARASRLLDADVRTARGDDVGDVEDLVVDLRRRTVNYAVVSFDPGWLSGERMAALPMNAFRALRYDDSLGSDLVIQVSQQEVQSAPVVSDADLPDDPASFARDMNLYSQEMGWRPVYGGGAVGAAESGSGRAEGLDRGPRATADGSRGRVPAPEVSSMERDFRASDVIGMDVHNPQGEGLGEIHDLVIDINNGRVHYAVLSFGGFLGLGEKLFAYPVGLFQTGRDWNELVLDIDREKLENAPGFERNNWPDWNSAEYRDAIDRHYGSEVRQPAQNARFVQASRLLDGEVRTVGGDDVGDVEDLVVNMREGRVRFAVVSFDPGWLKLEREVALPLKAFNAQREGDDLVVRVDRQRLRDAPVFDTSYWRGYDPAYQGYVDRYSTGMGWGPVYPRGYGLGAYGYGYGGFAHPPVYGSRPDTAAQARGTEEGMNTAGMDDERTVSPPAERLR
jgi:sporulation protein YlmC with PRC-barrel domain